MVLSHDRLNVNVTVVGPSAGKCTLFSAVSALNNIRNHETVAIFSPFMVLLTSFWFHGCKSGMCAAKNVHI